MTGISVLEIMLMDPAFAAVEKGEILEARFSPDVISPPDYTLEGSDIFYPLYFQGVWAASSRTKDVLAPCGFDLFTGGKDAYEGTIASEIDEGRGLEYRARFVPRTSPDG